MTKERMEKIRFWYGIFLSFFTVIIGILFIAQTWSIFRAASEAPYTAERISKHFKEIAIPVWLWVAAACVDLVWSIVDSLFTEPKKGRLAAQVDLKMAISRVKKRIPAGVYLPRIEGIECKHAIYRSKINGIFGGAVCLVAVFAILLLTDVLYLPVIKAHFFAAHDGVVDRITQTAVLAVVGLGLLSVATWLKEKDRKEEHKEYLAVLVAVKKENGKTIEEGGKREEVEEKKEGIFDKLRVPFKRIKERAESLSDSTKKKCTLGLRIGLGVFGVLCIGIGIYNGGMQDVLLKAINICTQCIGLG